MIWRGGRSVQAELQTLSIDGLELIDTDDYWFEAADGLDEPDRRIASAVNPGSDGGFVASTLYGMRGVSLSGALTEQRRRRDERRAISAGGSLSAQAGRQRRPPTQDDQLHTAG